MAAETNDERRSSLTAMLTDTTAQLVAGVKVPGWRFVGLALWMLLGPFQAFVTARNDPSVGNVVATIAVSLVLTATPIRMGIRLLAERYRVAYEFSQGIKPTPARLGTLNLSEGGTRLEFLQALLLSVAINLLAVAVAFVVIGQQTAGLATGVVAVVGLLVVAGSVNRYARARVGIYGPWSVTDPKM